MDDFEGMDVSKLSGAHQTYLEQRKHDFLNRPEGGIGRLSGGQEARLKQIFFDLYAVGANQYECIHDSKGGCEVPHYQGLYSKQANDRCPECHHNHTLRRV